MLRGPGCRNPLLRPGLAGRCPGLHRQVCAPPARLPMKSGSRCGVRDRASRGLRVAQESSLVPSSYVALKHGRRITISSGIEQFVFETQPNTGFGSLVASGRDSEGWSRSRSRLEISGRAPASFFPWDGQRCGSFSGAEDDQKISRGAGLGRHISSALRWPRVLEQWTEHRSDTL